MRLVAPFVLLAGVGMAACQPAVPHAASSANASSSAPTSTAPPADAPRVTSLGGHWRVAGIDGHDLDAPIGLALSADEAQLWWDPRCAGMARSYRIDGHRISFGSTNPPRAAGAPTRPVCAIGLPARLGDVFRALDDAVSVTRTKSNGILIVGPRHSVLLFSQ